jgi:Chaperone of endosialidase
MPGLALFSRFAGTVSNLFQIGGPTNTGVAFDPTGTLNAVSNGLTVAAFHPDQSMELAAPATNVTKMAINGTNAGAADTVTITAGNGAGIPMHVVNADGGDSMLIESSDGAIGVHVATKTVGSGACIKATTTAGLGSPGLLLQIQNNSAITGFNNSTGTAAINLTNNGAGGGVTAQFNGTGNDSDVCVQITAGNSTAIFEQFTCGVTPVGQLIYDGATTHIINISDSRLKRDVQPLDGAAALERILKMSPQTFWFTDGRHQTKAAVGYIAQEAYDAGFEHAVKAGSSREEEIPPHPGPAPVEPIAPEVPATLKILKGNALKAALADFKMKRKAHHVKHKTWLDEMAVHTKKRMARQNAIWGVAESKVALDLHAAFNEYVRRTDSQIDDLKKMVEEQRKQILSLTNTISHR